MSQQSRSETATLPSLAADTLNPMPVDSAGLVDAYAEDLVDTLFQGVDQLLEGDEDAIARAIQPEPDNSTDPELQPDPVDPSDTAMASLVPLPGELELTSDDFFAEATTPVSPDPDRPRTWLGKTVDRMLLVMTASTLLAAVGLWWNNYQHGAALRMASSAHSLQGQSNAEFLNYLQRSLEVIGNHADQADSDSSQVAQLPDLSVLSTSPPLLPPLAASTAPPGGHSQGPVNVIERVYIPYQTNPAPTTPQTAAAPSAPAAASSPGPVATASTSAVNHVLVGVLELGDRSAGLFEIDGVAQRVYIGERIGSSDWNLVSVSNEQATIRRNGEVRSIYIGQQF